MVLNIIRESTLSAHEKLFCIYMAAIGDTMLTIQGISNELGLPLRTTQRVIERLLKMQVIRRKREADRVVGWAVNDVSQWRLMSKV